MSAVIFLSVFVSEHYKTIKCTSFSVDYSCSFVTDEGATTVAVPFSFGCSDPKRCVGVFCLMHSSFGCFADSDYSNGLLFFVFSANSSFIILGR